MAVDKIWSKNGIRLGELAPATIHADAAGFYDSIAKLSPNTEAQHFIQKRALEISGAIRQTRALMVEQINSSIPWPFLTVLVFWISMLFMGFGLFARANTTVIVALLIGALSVSSAIFLILELNHPYLGLMRISGAPLRTPWPRSANERELHHCGRPMRTIPGKPAARLGTHSNPCDHYGLQGRDQRDSFAHSGHIGLRCVASS